MKIINQLCEYKDYKNVSKLFHDSYISESVYHTMRLTVPDMNETFAFCKLFDEWKDCDEIFFPTVTDAGFCFTFNALKLSEYLTNE